MQIINDQIVYSATDLVGFMECRHLANLERAAVRGYLTRPMREDPVLDRIAQRGQEHEKRFLGELRAVGLLITEIEQDEALSFSNRIGQGRDDTVEEMRNGATVIYQAVLFDGRRLGYADFLLRVEEPSDLGAWSYEVWDTKLARHAKASAVLQLCMYSAMVEKLQGKIPEKMHLVLGGVKRETISFRTADYAAYCRSVARGFEEILDAHGPSFPVATEPEPVEHCDVCRWSAECQAQWHAGDDLSLVANMTSRQRHAMRSIGVTTRTGLAEPPEPLPEHLDGAHKEALTRLQKQARIQVRGERLGYVISERVPPARNREGALIPDNGLLMLPEPSPGDLFFDIEGDPFFGSDEIDGIDYLFGIVEPDRPDDSGQPAFHAFWAVANGTVTTTGERGAFEAFIDLVMDRLAVDPSLHIYHYSPYEPTAVKRLAGRYGTREEEVDRLLRGQVFVDLLRSVRQGVRASVESYSIKRLEPLYGFKREIDLRDARASIVEFETWLELDQSEGRNGLLVSIEQYNRDDCVSTLHLRLWLEQQRALLALDINEDLPRPVVSPFEETEDSDAQKAVHQIVDALMAGLPEHLDGARDDEQARWLLAQLLNWHRREAKSFWWRYFFLKDELTDEERLEESDPIAGLIFGSAWKDPAPGTRSTIYRFLFPPQEHKIRVGESPHDPETGLAVGTVHHLDNEIGIIDLRIGSNRPVPTPTCLIPHDFIQPNPKPESLQRLARWAIEFGLDAPGERHAARDLLMRRGPLAGQALAKNGEDAQDAARRLALALDESYLAIQGPPGSGKSSVGAEMIVDLVAAGRRIGVTANSHKVIGEILEKTAKAAAKRGIPVTIGQRTNDDTPAYVDAVPLKKNEAARDALSDGSIDVVGGTTWLWARDDMAGSVDVLFVDEAGQTSLADVTAASLCARNLVLLGDPQQLDQPLQGTHPPGAERSALAHLLNGERVMPNHLGLFLDGTWRLHPDICTYTSEVFYEGRLSSHEGRERQMIAGVSALSGSGLRFIPVNHYGNKSDSLQEAEELTLRIKELFTARGSWTDENAEEHKITVEDVLVITPYNAQVKAIAEVLKGVRIGTVDKFQGQEAPISIYSMATSSAEDAPHGMEFLYSLNRLNVATSRARCVAAVVASPNLPLVRCKSPRQMQLANALVRLIELAV